MTTGGERRRFRAPADDDGVLIVPAAADAAVIVARNQARQSGWKFSLGGRSFAELATTARADLIAAASQYTARYRDMPEFAADRPLILSGHQPQFFHPGVWFKNFLLSAVGKKLGGTAINLVIDNDTPHAPFMSALEGTADEPLSVRLVSLGAEWDLPFEELSLQPRAGFITGIAKHVTFPLTENGFFGCREPLVADVLQPNLVRAARRATRLGDCVAEARHALEGEWGLATMEVRLSDVCRQPTFRLFALELLSRAAELRATYNQALADYRRENKIRSRSHPAPDLELADDYVEAPFWIWSTIGPRRRRLFVRMTNSGMELSDRGRLTRVIPPDHAGVFALETWEREGVKIRPRAFITTLFARLFLCDLFIHGIGGAKYDEVTDRLCNDFLDCEPPEYMTATATLRLPWGVTFPTEDDLAALVLKQWHLKHHPETFLADRADLAPLVAEKRQLIAVKPVRKEGRERRRRITELNQRLAAELADQQTNVAAEIEHTRGELRRAAVLNSREFSFVVFPAENLRRRLLDASVI